MLSQALPHIDVGFLGVPPIGHHRHRGTPFAMHKQCAGHANTLYTGPANTVHKACEYTAQNLQIQCTGLTCSPMGIPWNPKVGLWGHQGVPWGPMGTHQTIYLKSAQFLNISHGGPKWSHGCPKWFQRSSHGAPSGPMGKQTTFSENAQACWTLFKIECSGLFYIGSTGTCMCICVCIKGNGPCVHAW